MYKLHFYDVFPLLVQWVSAMSRTYNFGHHQPANRDKMTWPLNKLSVLWDAMLCHWNWLQTGYIFFSLGLSRLTEITQSTLKQTHKALHCSFFSTWFSISCCMHNYPCTPGAMRDETRVNHCFYFSRLLFIEDKNRSLYLEIQSATYTFWLLISIRYACNRNRAMAQKETWRQ